MTKQQERPCDDCGNVRDTSAERDNGHYACDYCAASASEPWDGERDTCADGAGTVYDLGENHYARQASDLKALAEKYPEAFKGHNGRTLLAWAKRHQEVSA